MTVVCSGAEARMAKGQLKNEMQAQARTDVQAVSKQEVRRKIDEGLREALH